MRSQKERRSVSPQPAPAFKLHRYTPTSQSLKAPPRNLYHKRATMSAVEILHHEPDSYARLLLLNQCYEAMPTSSKMVVFDLHLTLSKAFNGLIYQNTRHVLLSDPESGGKIMGILSVTDFIRVMLRLYRDRKQQETAKQNGDAVESSEKESIASLTISQYRDLISSEGKLKDMISIEANLSLLEAARMLADNHIHRLPVLDPENGSPLFILTHKRLLKFLWCFGHQFSQMEYHEKSAKDLGVGTWVGIRVVFPDTPLVDCLDILLHKGVSGLPVVERESFKVIDMYSRFDAIAIAMDDTATSLEVTVEQALAFKNSLDKHPTSDHVVSVRDTDTLWKTITVLVERNVHRVCAVNESGGIEGVISLSDVINHMVVKPGVDLKPLKPRTRHYTHKQGGDLSDSDLRNMLEESANQLEDVATGKVMNDLQFMSVK